MAAEPARAMKVFICYAREDELLLFGLEKHLRALTRQGLIDPWYDRKIVPGTDWKEEIDTRLNAADIILLLVSPDFIDAEYCYGTEMKRAMERHERAEAHVIPIILRHVYWEEAPFGTLQALPVDATSVTDHSWYTRDEAFFSVVRGIRDTIRQIQEAREEVARQAEKERGRKEREEQALKANERGNKYYVAGSYEEALVALQQAIGLNPALASAYFCKGRGWIALHENRNAIA